MPGDGLVLPPIKARIELDDSALKRAGSTASTTGKQIDSGLGPGKKSTDALEAGLEGLAAQFGITLPPQVKKSASALLGLVTDSSTTRAEVAALSSGVKGLASDLGINVPPQAEKGAVALKGLASSGLEAQAAVGLTSGAVVLVEQDIAKTGDTATGAGEKIQSAFETTQKASETLKTALKGVGSGGEEAAAGLQDVTSGGEAAATSLAGVDAGGEAASAGLGLVAGAAIAGVAALTAGVVVAKSIEDSYVSIADKVENFRRVTGASADDSSREVQVFEQLGVNADTASQAVYKLSKVVEATPAKLQAAGVEIARDNAGAVDLNKTLLNVADAYVHAGSAIQKDTILQTAFGKSGREMIPILEQGADGLRKLEEQVQLTFTDADLERVKQMKIHTEELKSEWQQYMDQLGGPITETQNNFADALLASNYANQKYQQGLADGTIKTEISGAALGKLLDKYQQEYYANQKVKEGATAASQAIQDQAQHVADLTTQLNASITALEGEAAAEQKLVNASIDAAESQDKITEAQVRSRDANRQVADAQTAYNQAVRDYGKNSPQAKAALDALTLAQIQARKAADDITKAQEDQYQSYLKAAEAAQQLQIEQDKANDVTGLQAQKNETEKLIDTLQAEADTLAPNSPLRQRLEEYIFTLKSKVPSEVTTKYVIQYTTQELVADAKQRGGHFAAGGRPPLGKVSEVGEHGVEVFSPDEPEHPQLLIGTEGPQPFVPPEPGTITPHGATPPARGRGDAPLAGETEPHLRYGAVAAAAQPIPTAPGDAAPAARLGPPSAIPHVSAPRPAAIAAPPASLPRPAAISAPAASLPHRPVVTAAHVFTTSAGPKASAPPAAWPMSSAPSLHPSVESPSSRPAAGAQMNLGQVAHLLEQLVDRTTDPNPLLRELIDAVTAAPAGQTGLEAALYKAVQGAGLNRLRGMAGR